MFALYNLDSKKFFRYENEYRNCVEVDTFIEAITFKTKKEALYTNAMIKGNYKVIDIYEAIEMNLI